MEKINFKASELKDLIDRLKERGHNIKYIAARIGYDDGQILSDAIRGKSQKKVNEATILIKTHFSKELDEDVPDVITLKTLNDKLDILIELLSKKS